MVSQMYGCDRYLVWIDSVSLRYRFCGKSDGWMEGVSCDTRRMDGWMD